MISPAPTEIQAFTTIKAYKTVTAEWLGIYPYLSPQLRIRAFFVTADVPELCKVEEHLKVAIHVTCVTLIHQTSIFVSTLLLPTQGQHNEQIRPRLTRPKSNDLDVL